MGFRSLRFHFGISLKFACSLVKVNQEFLIMDFLESRHLNNDGQIIMKESILDHHGTCLALIVSRNFGDYGTNFVTSSNNPLQMGVILRNAGDVIGSHHHKPCNLMFQGQRQEFIHVVEGRVSITFFDNDGNEIAKRILESGDSLLQLGGGHRFEFELPTKMVEIKQGPYGGKANDKVVHE